jgi:hypothetical protein
VRNKNRQPHGRTSYGSGVHASCNTSPKKVGFLLTIHVTLVPLLPYISSLCDTHSHSSIAKSPLLTFPTSTSIHLVFSKQPSQMQVPSFYSWEIAPRPAFGSLGSAVLGIKIFCWDLGSWVSNLSPCSLAKNPMETRRMPRKITAERQRRLLNS